MWFEFIRVVVVIALLIVAACLATPPGRLPLALRGIKRILSHDRGVSEESAVTSASASRRFIAFVLVVVAVALAVI